MKNNSVKDMVILICKAVTLAMGVAVVALSAMKMIEVQNAITLLGIGTFCAGVALFDKKKSEE